MRKLKTEAGLYRVLRLKRGESTEREEEKAGQIEPEDQDDDHESHLSRSATTQCSNRTRISTRG